MFTGTNEAGITRAIFGEFSELFRNCIETDVLIVGGGPSGLVAAMDLSAAGHSTLIIERNNYLGGGFWIGGFLMNTLTFRSPSEKMLEELNIPYKEKEKGLYTSFGPHACSRLILSACEAGAKILNMTSVTDVVYRNGNVEGVVVNWTPVESLPRAITCVDPVSLESKVVIDCTGHDASVIKHLDKRGVLSTIGFGAMDVKSSEEAIVENTSMVHPGLIAAGMAVSTTFGVPRMGPTFGSMLLSGRKAAGIASEYMSSIDTTTGTSNKAEVQTA